jgi:preprotein translocase subunit Sec61beta
LEVYVQKRIVVFTGILVAVLFAMMSISGCGSSAPVLQSIAVTPSPANGTVGGATVPFTATGAFSDGTHSTTISGLAWSSSDTNTATIDPTTGVATCVAANASAITITATAPNAAGSSTNVTGTSQLTCAAAG